MNDAVLVHDEGHVRTLIMNRAKSRNALNMEMGDALLEAIHLAQHDRSVRCLRIKGDQTFMAGGDIRYFAEHLDRPAHEWQVRIESLIGKAHGVVTAIRTMDKPVVASIEGAAAGFGLSLLMACDFAVASEDALFTLAYVNIGTSPDGGSTFALPRHVGAKRAAEIAMLGDRFGAEDALQWGLLNKHVPQGMLDEESMALATRLSSLSTRALGRTKALLRQSLYTSLEAQLRAELEMFGRSSLEDDFREGVGAFLEKRKPNFKG